MLTYQTLIRPSHRLPIYWTTWSISI